MAGYQPKGPAPDRPPPPVNPGPTSEPKPSWLDPKATQTWVSPGGPPASGMSRDEQVRAAALAAAVEFVTVSTQTMAIAAAASKDGATELEALMGQVLGTLSIPGQARRFQRFIETGLWDD